METVAPPDLPVSWEVEHDVMAHEIVPPRARRRSDHDSRQFTGAELFVLQPRQRCLVPGALLPLIPAPQLPSGSVPPPGLADSHCFSDGLPAPADLVRRDRGGDTCHGQGENYNAEPAQRSRDDFRDRYHRHPDEQVGHASDPG
jgi:hypothetical protein